MQLFEHQSYKAYLKGLVEARGRGEKSRLAQSARCHLAYVHQVLQGAAHFSFEQAELINTYLAHTDEESEFFLLLVSYERAGSDSLRRRYERKINAVITARTQLDHRLKNRKILPEEQQAVYYSAWYYSAIHVLITIPEFQTKEALTERLRLRPKEVGAALEALTEMGLARKSGARYLAGDVTLHLKADSPWIPRHHASWRIQTIQNLEQRDPMDLHYTSVVSMAPGDLPRVRKILVDAIEEVRKVVRDSKEEDLVCYAVDCFRP